MRFVEETGGSWTAEQLRAAEAEIEQQKREWEANRLAALKKAEEDEKRAQAEENDLLTYSREDAKNQVNNNKKSLKRRPVNRRLLSIKRGSTNLSKRRRAFREQTTKRTLRNNTRIVSPTPSLPHRKSASSSASKAAETKRAAAKRANSQSPKKAESSRPKRTRSETVTIVSSEEEPEANDDKTDEDDDDVDNDTDDTDHESKNNYTHKNGSEYDGGHSEPSRSEEFDDSECSLDVMIDTTDSAESNDLAQMKYSESSRDEDGEGDENDVDNDDADSSIGLRRRMPYALNRKESAEHLNSTPANDIDNHIDANSPRTTRSHGRVTIDLWKLDVSQILPDCRQRGRAKTSTSATSNNLDISSNTNNGDVDENNEALDDQDQSVNDHIDLTADDTDEQNNTASTLKPDASAPADDGDVDDDDGTGDGDNDDAEKCDNSSNNIENTNDRSKVVRQAKILDGFQKNSSVVLSRLKQTTGTSHTAATITSPLPPPPKSSKNDKHIVLKSNSGSKNHKTLDSWVSISRKSPKIILNKNDCNINAVAMKTKRKTNVDVHTRNRSSATNNSKNHSDHDL